MSSASALVKLSFVKTRFAERVASDVMRKLSFCPLRRMATFEQVVVYGKRNAGRFVFESQINKVNNVRKVTQSDYHANTGCRHKETSSS